MLRTADPGDARATVVAATPSGLAAMDDLRRYRQNRIETLFGSWSAAEQAELGRVLGHLNQVLAANALG